MEVKGVSFRNRSRNFGREVQKLARAESARENLAKKAKEMGANAIVGYNYYKRKARGTAVVVE